ncbi:hypothetical protein, partial [Pseudoalteromonas luteoviolacea]
VLNAAVQVGIGIACNAAAPACLGIYNTAQSYAVTGDVGSALKSGAIAAVSAYAFQQVGQHFKAEFGIKPGSDLSFGDLELGQQLQWAGSHAVVGGVSSVLSGGKFGHGFISAGFTKMAMGNAGFNLNNRAWPAIAGRTAIAAIVGGTASALTGGKFSNGARTAAMMHVLNGEMPNSFVNKLSEEQKYTIFKLKKRLEVEYSSKDGFIANVGDKIVIQIKESGLQFSWENGRLEPLIGSDFANEITALGLKNGIGEIALEVGRNSIDFKAKVQVPGFLFFNKKTVEVYSADVVDSLLNSPVRRIYDYASGHPEVTCKRLGTEC